MPTILRRGPCRVFFYSADAHEPPHVHVARDDAKAKFWLEPIAFASATGFQARALLEIQSLLNEHRALLLEAWHDCFNSSG